ncbi:hypothetical protein HT105_25040, partial [Bacteroides fragilis]|nr:hypothetical protein [Bacteroides fragilis]
SYVYIAERNSEAGYQLVAVDALSGEETVLVDAGSRASNTSQRRLEEFACRSYVYIAERNSEAGYQLVAVDALSGEETVLVDAG